MAGVRRRILKIAVGTMVFLVAGLVLAYLFRRPLFGGFVARWIEGQLHETLGGRWAVGEIGGSWLSDVDVHDIRLVAPARVGTIVEASLPRARATYDLRGLVFGHGLGAVASVELDALDLALDVDVGGGSGLPPAQGIPVIGTPPAAPWLPPVRVDASVRVRFGDQRLDLGRVHVATDGPRALDVEVADVAVGEPAEAVEGSIAGRLVREESGALVWTSSTSLAGLGLPRASWREDGTAEAVLETGGGAIRVDFGPEAVTAATDGVDFAALPDWVRALVPASVGTPERGRVSGRVALEDVRGPQATFSLHVADLSWRTWTVTSLAAEGRTTRDGTASVTRLDLVAPGASIALRDAMLDPSLPYVLARAERLDVHVDDLSRWVPGLDEAIRIDLGAHGEGPRTLAVTSLAGTTPWATVEEGSGTIRLADEPDRWKETEVDLALTVATADLGGFVDELAGSFEGRARVRGPLGAVRLVLDVAGRQAFAARIPVERVETEGVVRWPRADLEKVTVVSPVATVEGSLALSMEPWALPGSNLRGTVRDAGALARTLGMEIQDYEGAATFTTTLAVGTGGVDGEARVVLENVSVGTNELGRATIEVAYAGKDIVLRHVEAAGDWGRASLSATADLERQTGRLSTLDARVGETDVRLRAPLAVAFDETGIRVEGLAATVGGGDVDADLLVDLEASTAVVRALRWRQGGVEAHLCAPARVAWNEASVIRLADVEAAVGDLEVETDLTVDVGGASARVERLTVRGGFGEAHLAGPLAVRREGDRVAVRGLDARGEGVRAEGAADVFFDEERAVLASLAVTRGDRTLRLEHPARVDWSKGVALEDLAARLVGEGTRVEGRIAWDGTLRASLRVEDLPLSLVLPGLGGVASADVHVDGESGAIDATVEGLAYAWLRGSASFRVTQAWDGPLRLADLRVEGARGLALGGEGTLPLHLGANGLVPIEAVPPRLSIRGRIPLPENVPAGPAAVAISGTAKALTGTVTVPGRLLEGDAKGDDLALRFTATRDRVAVGVDPGSNEAIDLEGRIELDRGLDWTRPDTWSDLADAQVSGRVTGTLRSWQPVGELVGGVDKLEGAARVTATVGGTLADPDVEAHARFENVGIVLKEDVSAITGLGGRIDYEHGVLRVRDVAGELGYGPFSLSGTVERGGDGTVAADLRLVGRYVLLARTDGMRARVNVDLKLVGPLPDPLLSGDVEVADLLYVKPFSLSGGSLPGGDGETPADGACDEKEGKSSGFTVPPMPGIEAGPFASVRLDVKLHAKKTIRVRMNLANADVSVDGHVGGTGRSPAPSGRITTEDALIFLPTRTLSLRSAEVGFPVEDPTRPRVAASVRTQASGYEVGGSAQGRLPDVDISVWSRPKLPDAQALQLLVTGGLGGGGGGGGGSISVDQALTTATDNLLTAFKGTASPETRPFFDRFTLTVGRQTSRRGQDTIEGEVRVLDQLYFDGERDEFDETNLGVVWRLHFR